MKTKIALFVLFVLGSLTGTMAQSIETWVDSSEKVPVEKIYLHTDREFYFTGETIRFKSYLTDSRSGKLIPGAENIYINLVHESGAIVSETILLSLNGQSHSGITLPDTLKEGGYILQAFTNYLLNFGEASFFQKPLKIAHPAGSLRAIDRIERSAASREMAADASFLPEGGVLLENTSNLVAFKITDKNGYGIDASGAVIDQTGETVTDFKTDYRGMGIFFLTPERGKSYHATINGFPSFRFSFDSLVSTEGTKIQLINHTSNKLIINTKENSGKFNGETFYIANMHRGEVLFYRPVKIETEDQVLKFDSKMLKGGINRLVLLNSNLKPVSERLLFSKNFKMNELEVTTDSVSYAQRSEIKLNISGKNSSSAQKEGHLSLTVVHENAFPESGVSQHILSSLLIDSELNGFAGPSADYFTDAGLPSESKLRLLMLTSGWSSYFWNNVPPMNKPLEFKQTAGIDLKGVATDVITGQPIDEGEISLVIEKDAEMAFLTDTTGKTGEFTFPGLVFNDTAKVLVQAKNEKGRQNTAIMLNPVLKKITPQKSDLMQAAGFPDVPADLHRIKYTAVQEWNRFDAKQRAKAERLHTSEPVRSPVENDSHFRIYENADHVVQVPQNEASSGNILDFLSGKVPGLDINSEQVSIRGTSNFDGNSTPLFLIDGVPLLTGNNTARTGPGSNEEEQPDQHVIETVKSIPMGDIDKVEILKSSQNLATFGTEGSNGVIAIYTRRGDKDIPARAVKGMIEKSISGYAPAKKFYVPKYTPENKNWETPDYRTTLFWEPEISLKNDSVEYVFSSSDQSGTYKIFVEGINEEGEICLGKAQFVVEEQK
ncbi:TonB-dependent Receptor Plug Domain [Tangfeifania diversioriginum]|uniref:TonB-dependent Receptor Plug Domain n=1 Tax=Tangfeifania diversioriginum TaxID=1168035 RepID=A0A1M6ABW6_9BACT|nr:TonB-dependent receptor plug domain-containing protein [Tangfeifania diversioriginum]SHI34014.1 TonB-dependent Receptor Plug Domain [Tangfeifania diversioriginum]